MEQLLWKAGSRQLPLDIARQFWLYLVAVPLSVLQHKNTLLSLLTLTGPKLLLEVRGKTINSIEENVGGYFWP